MVAQRRSRVRSVPKVGSSSLWASEQGPAVPFPADPSLSVTSRQEAPEARRWAILAAPTALRGLRSRLPLARAFRRPASTRSAMRLRSNAATAPSPADRFVAVRCEAVEGVRSM